MKDVLHSPSEVRPEMKLGAKARFISGRGFFFVLGMAFMWLTQALTPVFHGMAHSGAAEMVANARMTHPGMLVSSQHKAWGDFEYTMLPLEQPGELLPDTTQPLAAPRWFFGNQTRPQVVNLFETCGFTHEQKDKLLDPQRWQTASNGIYVFPPSQVVLEMSQPTRERLYSILDDYPMNSAQCNPFRFRPEWIEDWFAATGLGAAQVDVLRKLLYKEGGSLCFCDGDIVQGLFSTNDFKRLVKSLYTERTFLMRVRITHETDIDSLIKYWGVTSRAQTIRPLLNSIAKVPGGGSINISYLLSPFARVRLYTYANAATDPSAAAENCFWSAMNYFSEKPDNRFLDAGYVQRVLASDYERTTGPAGYGDIITLFDGRGTPIHMCVYLADDVVFTKNGRDYIEPWVLMKLPDMVAGYQAKNPVQVSVFRPKKS